MGPAITGAKQDRKLFSITDSAGLGLKSTVELVSEGNEYRQSLTTDDAGRLDVKRLPYGIYQIHIETKGFEAVSQSVEIHSALPADLVFKLKPSKVTTSVTVSESGTSIDPHQAGSVNDIGSQTIQDRVTSLPGRSLPDLVNNEPGWLFEGNAVLHPRGSEYQTQFVVDGIPLIDNRSPGFGTEIEVNDIDSMRVYTAGFPAEYGRKMGGVVEVNTLRQAEPGFSGETVLSGGSFDTASAYTQLQYSWKGNTLGVSGYGGMTDHYLNPVVPENFHNSGTTAGWAGSYERDLTPKDRLTFTVRHSLARYEIPNELVQQNGAVFPNPDGSCCTFIPGGQQQNSDNFETMGTVSYQHIFSPDAIGWLRGMVRDNSNDYYSNALSWPESFTQHNDFKEIYFNGSAAIHHGRHEIKAGIESDNLFLHENFSDAIPYCLSSQDVTSPNCPIAQGLFDPGTPLTFAFTGSRPDLEQSAYVQDAIRLGNWTVNAGLRWDHYQLLVNQNAVSPRLSVAYYLRSAGLLVHFSYDRVFQTPSFENILLSSSPTVLSLDPGQVIQAPVLPSHGNYYEVGATKAFANKLRLDVNYYQRRVNNYADDDVLPTSPISFPLSFDHAIIYGAEAKIEVLKWWRFSGWASYSYMVGNVWFPETGGLQIGVTPSSVPLTGHLPDSQDQRNTLRARVRYQIDKRLWIAVGADYNSGLPFEPIDNNPESAANAGTYGQAVINGLNFNRDRILPHLTENISVGADLYQHERRSLRLQADCNNVSNKLEILDYGGLFSGNAIGPPRSFTFRLSARF